MRIRTLEQVAFNRQVVGSNPIGCIQILVFSSDSVILKKRMFGGMKI